MTRLVVPSTLERYAVRADVLRQTERFLLERGNLGVEGTVVWIGFVDSDLQATIDEAYIPEQVAYRTPNGLAVEVTRTGLQALIGGLPPGRFGLARVHSHGEGAYHSEADDLNMIISHHGAISIVVPHLARYGVSLAGCSVNELRHGHGWVELPSSEVARRFEITP